MVGCIDGLSYGCSRHTGIFAAAESTIHMSQNLSDQEVIRRESLTKLRALGIEPFPAAQFPVTHTSEQVKDLAVEESEDLLVLAGRYER